MKKKCLMIGAVLAVVIMFPCTAFAVTGSLLSYDGNNGNQIVTATDTINLIDLSDSTDNLSHFSAASNNTALISINTSSNQIIMTNTGSNNNNNDYNNNNATGDCNFSLPEQNGNIDFTLYTWAGEPTKGAEVRADLEELTMDIYQMFMVAEGPESLIETGFNSMSSMLSDAEGPAENMIESLDASGESTSMAQTQVAKWIEEGDNVTNKGKIVARVAGLGCDEGLDQIRQYDEDSQINNNNKYSGESAYYTYLNLKGNDSTTMKKIVDVPNEELVLLTDSNGDSAYVALIATQGCYFDNSSNNATMTLFAAPATPTGLAEMEAALGATHMYQNNLYYAGPSVSNPGYGVLGYVDSSGQNHVIDNLNSTNQSGDNGSECTGAQILSEADMITPFTSSNGKVEMAVSSVGDSDALPVIFAADGSTTPANQSYDGDGNNYIYYSPTTVTLIKNSPPVCSQFEYSSGGSDYLGCVVGNNGVGNIYEWEGEFSSTNGFAANDPIVSDIPYVSVGKNGSSIAVNGGNQINIVQNGCIVKGDVYSINVPNNDILSSLTGIGQNYYLGLTSPLNGNQTAYLVQYTGPSNNYIVSLGTFPESNYNFASGGGYAAVTCLNNLYLVNSSGDSTIGSTPDNSNIESLDIDSSGECTVTTALGDSYSLLPGLNQFIDANVTGKWYFGQNLFYEIESNGDELLRFVWTGNSEPAYLVQMSDGDCNTLELGGMPGTPTNLTKGVTYNVLIPSKYRYGVVFTSVGGSAYSAFPNASPTETFCGDGVQFKLNSDGSEQLTFTWTGDDERASDVLAESLQYSQMISLGGLSGAPAANQYFIQGDTYSIVLPLTTRQGYLYSSVGGSNYSEIPPWIPGDGLVYQLRSNGDEVISFNWVGDSEPLIYINASTSSGSAPDIPLNGLPGTSNAIPNFIQGDTYTVTIPSAQRDGMVYTSIGGTQYSSIPTSSQLD
ncbi:MAG: hypothetical protein NTX05_01620 [Fusobacteria bacterium]|nr:hypothetical protein [Fusobacteriota bacterium]